MPKTSALMNDELVKQLIDYIKVGNYLNAACAAVGVSQITYHKWLRDGLAVEEMVAGRDDEEELKDRMREGELILGLTVLQVRSWLFREEVQMAIAMGEAYAVAMVRKHMPDHYQAAIAFLERRFPSRWRRRDQLDIGESTDAIGGMDESLLLNDPKAVHMIHEALELVAIPEVIVVDEVKDDDERPPAS